MDTLLRNNTDIISKPDGYFAMQVIRIKPKNLVNYVTTIPLDFLTVQMEVGYNDRTKKRYIALKTNNDTVLLERTFIDVGRRVSLNNNAKLLGLNYYIIVEPVDATLDTRDFFEWSDMYTITFVGNRLEVNQFIDEKYREAVVGN